MFRRRRKRPVEDFSEEIRAHLELEAEDCEAEGMSEPAARTAARKAFGNVLGAEERFYERSRLMGFDALRQDVRYALRTMRQNPAFTLAAVLTLALGMGANTAIFSLLDTVLLRSLPVEDPARLYFVSNAGARGVGGSPPYPCFERFRSQSRAFSGMAAYTNAHFKVRIDEGLEQALGARVSGEYYRVLGVKPVAGRLLEPEDERLDPPVAVISYGYWQRRFGGDAAAIGRTFDLDDRAFTIVGVTPREFHGLVPGHRDELTVPITTAGAEQLGNTGSWWFRCVARLNPGVEPEQARAEVDPIFQAFMNEFPSFDVETRRNSFSYMALTPAARGLDELRKRFSEPLRVLMAVAGLVLLIACANITNLLLARASAREREFAIRTAIGAGRWRLFRQLLAETALLFAAGAAAGLFVAYWAVRGLTLFFAGGSSPVLLDGTWSWRVLGFTAGVSLGATLVFGTAPILRALRVDPHAAMKTGARAGRGSMGLGRLLVVFQVALSLILLAGAALFLGTLRNLHALDPGFRAERVTLTGIELLETSYREPAARAAAWERVLAAVRGLPGVGSAALSAMTPLDRSYRGIGFAVPGFRPGPSQRGIGLNTVSEGYFATLGTPLVRGRAFTEQDGLGAPYVCILNETAARLYFEARDPIGTVVELNNAKYEIVGVVADAKHVGLREDAGRFVYVPVRQPFDRNFRMTLSMRTESDPRPIVAAVQSRLRGVDRDILVARTELLSGQIERSLLQERLVSALATAFGALALLLSAVGLYGVLAYSVARRTGEIGIRIALGARPALVSWSVLGQTLRLVGFGLALGIPASMLLARYAASLLYGVAPTSVAVHAGAALVLTAVAAAASYIPARRASRIDPLEALRCE